MRIKFTYSKKSMTFLDTEIYKNLNWVKWTTTYRKPNNHRNFLHCYWAHPKSLKDSIAFTQVLHIKRICSETWVVIRNYEFNLKIFMILHVTLKILWSFWYLGPIRLFLVITDLISSKPQFRCVWFSFLTYTL